jgi:glycosyltransferase involved in cell wall biosynthesis
MNIDYEWMSKLTDEQMQEAYATSDLLLFCSTLEGFGMPILEANAVGLPVITSDQEPMSQLGAGWAKLVDCKDVQSISEGIVYCLKRCTQGNSTAPLDFSAEISANQLKYTYASIKQMDIT